MEKSLRNHQYYDDQKHLISRFCFLTIKEAENYFFARNNKRHFLDDTFWLGITFANLLTFKVNVSIIEMS